MRTKKVKSKCIVFGAGQLFETFVSVIEEKYDILAVADNNEYLYGKNKCGYLIISPNDINKYSYDVVVICSTYSKEIQEQLLNMGISDICLLIAPGLLYNYGTNDLAKEIRFNVPLYKKRDDKLHILFAQIYPCTRTMRFAKLLTQNGIKCSLAYFGTLGREMESSIKIFNSLERFFSYSDFVEYAGKSEYDLIHCSNEPDILTCLLSNIEKPVVHDCHDFLSLRDSLTAETMSLELISNTNSDGYIYPNKECLQIAIERYRVDESRAIYMENYPSEIALPKKQLPKLSSIDQQIHCVYEGSITDDPNSYRFFEEQWLKFASLGIHVHFYTQFREDYCHRLDSLSEYIHYEGNMDAYSLLTEITQYDVGLCVFGESPQFKAKVDIGSPNKLYEYLAAGLPVVLSDHKFHKCLTENNTIGKVLNWDGDIVSQLKRISKISIPKDFITDNGFTMEHEVDKLIAFYRDVINRVNNKKK